MSYNVRPSELLGANDLKYIFSMCVNSPFVSENAVYKKAADGVVLGIDPTTDINAYATKMNDQYVIAINRGLINWSSVFGLIWVCLDSGKPLRDALKMVDWCRKNGASGEASDETVNMFTSVFNLKLTTFDIERWRSNTMAIVLSCVAHELGHICLSHVETEYDPTVMSSNRNIERAADLFSASVIQTGPNVNAGAIGAVLLEVSLNCISAGNGTMTHPSSKERIENIFTSFRGQFISKTMSENVLRKLAGLQK